MGELSRRVGELRLSRLLILHSHSSGIKFAAGAQSHLYSTAKSIANIYLFNLDQGPHSSLRSQLSKCSVERRKGKKSLGR